VKLIIGDVQGVFGNAFQPHAPIPSGGFKQYKSNVAASINAHLETMNFKGGITQKGIKATDLAEWAKASFQARQRLAAIETESKSAAARRRNEGPALHFFRWLGTTGFFAQHGLFVDVEETSYEDKLCEAVTQYEKTQDADSKTMLHGAMSLVHTDLAATWVALDAGRSHTLKSKKTENKSTTFKKRVNVMKAFCDSVGLKGEFEEIRTLDCVFDTQDGINWKGNPFDSKRVKTLVTTTVKKKIKAGELPRK